VRCTDDSSALLTTWCQERRMKENATSARAKYES
jgi:hypothetical protein